MAGAGVLLATARTPALVVLAAMLGNVAVSAGETGPFLSIEQVLVARAAAGRDLTLRMSLYNLVGYVAMGLGALVVAALPGGNSAAATSAHTRSSGCSRPRGSSRSSSTGGCRTRPGGRRRRAHRASRRGA